MNWLLDIAFIIYTLALLAITVYCLMQLHLLFHYRRYHRTNGKGSPKATQSAILAQLPLVTIQLPIYNEMYVVERLIDAVMKLDYPQDRFEVHVLDDSTDETVDIVRRKVDYYKAKGYQIEVFHRAHRTGSKRGPCAKAWHMRGVISLPFSMPISCRGPIF
ncbi:MAG: hypothetical protein KatS3mg029_0222 [Saprospiraceae bacterium]|nr:MAG: hypothetical protein KatS3mg029_0222 [Saprospiraceae bacterium]